MNFKIILKTIGKILILEAFFLCLPLIVSFIYGDGDYLSFIIPIGIVFAVGFLLSLIKCKDKSMYAKEGFVTVALCWLLISLFGCLPFILSRQIPNFVDAFFETVSGFTTTGASTLDTVENLSKSMMFWRLFTHWIGGMGVIVFVVAIMPGYNVGIMHIFRAESPGPSVGKLVSKLKYTARILYSIYIVLTVIEIVMLIAGGMPIYDSVLYSFSTAGTGGFAITDAGVSIYNSVYIEMVMAVFMMLFGISFNVYYFIIVKEFAKAFRSEELRVYLIIIIIATGIIAVNLLSVGMNFVDGLRYSFFQVTSVISTTGLSTKNFSEWPALSKSILMFLTMTGACAGSTGGGIKIIRFMVLAKSTKKDINKLLKPRSVISVQVDGEPVNKETVMNVRSFFIMWVIIVILSTFILSIDVGDLFSNFSASLACIGNVGPGLTELTFTNYTAYAWYSKIILSVLMLAGRLEIFPLIILLSPMTWRRK